MTAPTRLPLAAAALGLLGDGGTPTMLVDRFAELGATVPPALADAVLGDLLGLGLERVAAVEGGDRWFVPTSLGSQAVAGSVAGSKLAKARDLGIPILDEAGMQRIIAQGPGTP